ncbi:MAG: S1C family serine protease, partial [Pseudomonadales bacterium]
GAEYRSYFRLKKTRCGIKDQARARHRGEKCGLALISRELDFLQFVRAEHIRCDTGFTSLCVEVSSSTIGWVLPQLLNHGRVIRGRLGITARSRSLDRRLVRQLELPAEIGVEVLKLDANGPAARGGLRSGDVIVAVQGLHRFLTEWPLREPVDIKILRRSTIRGLTVVPVERREA